MSIKIERMVVWACLGLAPLPDAQDLPWTAHGFTNVVEPEAPARFYQLRVRKP